MKLILCTFVVLFCAVAVSATETKKKSICTVCQYNTAGANKANPYDPTGKLTLRDSQKDCKDDPGDLSKVECTSVEHACVNYVTTVTSGDEEAVSVQRGCQARADCDKIDNKLKVKTGNTLVEVTCGASGLPMSVLIGLMTMLGALYQLH